MPSTSFDKLRQHIINPGYIYKPDFIALIRATEAALAQFTEPGRDMTVQDITDLHQLVMPEEESGIRLVQNWIGGVSPLTAVFVPPPATEVPRLLEDLLAFINHSPLLSKVEN